MKKENVTYLLAISGLIKNTESFFTVQYVSLRVEKQRWHTSGRVEKLEGGETGGGETGGGERWHTSSNCHCIRRQDQNLH